MEKVQNEQANKYLTLARRAANENNAEDAKRYYDMLRTECPDNGEANFFYQFYSLMDCKNKEIASKFVRLCESVGPSITRINDSAESVEDKVASVKAICDAFIPKTWELNRYMNKLTVKVGNETSRVLPASDIQRVCRDGILTLYKLGDAIYKYFPLNKEAKDCAMASWKEGVSLQQTWYSLVKDKTLPQVYTQKIQKIDPSYVMPKKAGCITLADKKQQ